MNEYACQKDHIVSSEDNDEYWRLMVMEVDSQGIEEVLDITHHNSEELADTWLREHWGLESPPADGVKLYFSAEGFRA